MINKKIDNYVDLAIRYLLPLIFVVPFIVSQDYYFPYITPRNFLFRIIISVVLALYLYLYFRNKEKYSFGCNKVVVGYLSLAVVLTVSSIINHDWLYSFWGNYERMDGLLNLYYLIALFLVILGVYHSKKQWLQLLRMSVFSSFMVSILALSQHWGINLFIESAGGARVTATLGNATYLAVFSLFNLFFALYLIFKYSSKKPKLELWLFYALDIFLLGAEIFTEGRGLLYGIFSDLRLIILFLAPQIFIHLQYYFYKAGRTIKYSLPAYLALVILLNFISLFNTQTRGVLVGIFAAVLSVSIFLLFSKYVNKKIKYFIISGLIVVILFASSIFMLQDSGFVQNNNTLRRVADISVSDTTTETRLLTWQLSLKAWQEKPILGWGQENFYRVFNQYFPNQIFKGGASRVWFDRPHNVFLQQLVEGGILGLLAYLSIFSFALLNLWRHYRKTHNPVTISVFGGLLIAYLVQNFFVFDSINSYIPMVLFLAVSAFLSGNFKSNKQWISDKYFTFALPILVLIFGFYLNIPQLATNKDFMVHYNSLRAYIGQGQYQRQDVLGLLEVIERQYLGRFELRQVYAEFVPALIQGRIFSPEETRYFIDTAEEAMLKSIDEQPNNVRHHMFLVNLYFHASILDRDYSQRAVDLIVNKAIPLSPTRVQLYYFLGKFYMNLGNNDLAIESFLKGRDLAPSVFESYYHLIMGALAMDDIDLADNYFNEMEEKVGSVEAAQYLDLIMLYNHFGYEERADEIKNYIPQ